MLRKFATLLLLASFSTLAFAASVRSSSPDAAQVILVPSSILKFLVPNPRIWTH